MAARATTGPILKWAGGKRQLLPELRRYYPTTFHTYVEPFFGSGAVFFDLQASKRLAGHDVVLIDSNPDLVGCYETVRDHPDAVARELERLAEAHAAGGRAHYYAVSDGQFNPERERLRAPDGRIPYTPALAAMLIYLNRAGYNGLFRVNSRGRFNVPAGRYERPTLVSRDHLRRVSDALGAPGVSLHWGSFRLAADRAGAGDFVYSDPPYAPLSRTARFTSYTAAGFEPADQAELQRIVIALAGRGSHVLVSNSTAVEIAALYETDPAAHAAGLRVFRVPARRAINSNPARRGVVDEFLITNIDGQAPATQTS